MRAGHARPLRGGGGLGWWYRQGGAGGMYAAPTGEPFGERWRWVRGRQYARSYGVVGDL